MFCIVKGSNAPIVFVDDPLSVYHIVSKPFLIAITAKQIPDKILVCQTRSIENILVVALGQTTVGQILVCLAVAIR